MTEDPTPRLRNEPRVSERLRRDLEHARMHMVDFDVEGGLRTLHAALDGSESGGTLASQGSKTALPKALRSLASKWWGWAALSTATLGVVWWTHGQSSPQAAPTGRAPEPIPSQEQRTTDVAGLGTGRDRETRLASKVAANDAEGTAKRESARGLRAEQAARAIPARVRGDSAGEKREPAARSLRAPSRPRRESADHLAPHALPPSVRAAPAAVEAHTSKDRSGEADSDDVAERPAPAPLALEEASSATAARPGDESKQRGAESEVEHLARVRRELTHDPARALEAAREGQRTFAGGLFHEERTALIVFALARLQRVEQVLREGRSYLRTYPRGPFAAPVREIVTRFEEPDR